MVSQDGRHCLPVTGWPNLLSAIERWTEAEPMLRAMSARLAEVEGEALVSCGLLSPLPRTWQWLDGSAFTTHGDLMQVAFHMDPVPTDRPLMYQGMSDRFLAPCEDALFPDEALGIDFEGEFGVIVDAVPMGTSAAEAVHHIRLLVQINDWSLRTLAPIEMKTGFGWVQAKPACSMAPFAVTLEELGSSWKDGRVCMDLQITRNSERFGKVNGDQMPFPFQSLLHTLRGREVWLRGLSSVREQSQIENT